MSDFWIDLPSASVSVPNPLPVSGTVAVSNFPATQPVSGTVTANAGTSLNTSALNLETTQSSFKTANHTDLAAINTTVTDLDSKVPSFVDRTNLNQNITALNQTVSISTANMGSIALYVKGTFVATLSFEATINGTDWFSWFGYNGSALNNIQSITAPDEVFFSTVGIQQFRVNCTAYTSGTAVVSLAVSQSFSGQIYPVTAPGNESGAMPVLLLNTPISTTGQNVLYNQGNTAPLQTPNVNFMSINGGSAPVLATVSASSSYTSVNNNTTTNLASGASFNSIGETASNYNAITIESFADQNLTISVIWGGSGDVTDTYTVAANTGDIRTFKIGTSSSGFKIKVTNNGGSTTTVLRVLTFLNSVSEPLPRSLTQLGNLKTSLQESLPAGTNSIGQVTTNAGTNTSTALLNLESTQSSFKTANHTDLAAINTTLQTALVREISDPNGTIASVLNLGTQPTDSLNGIVSQSILHGHTTAGGGSYVDVKVSPSGALQVDGSSITQPVSGSVEAQAVATSSFPVNSQSTTNTLSSDLYGNLRVVDNNSARSQELLLMILKEIRAMRLAMVSLAINGNRAKESDFDPNNFDQDYLN